MTLSPPRLLTKTVASFVQQLGIPEAGLSTYLDPKLSHLTAPDAMAGRSEIAGRLAEALRRKERIVVFGDYDCDGMTATAILSDVLEALGGQVFPLLASRFEGGYGVSEPALARILEQKPALVVTCDCGSSDHESLEKLRQAGVDVAVVDHHLVPERPLPALAFLNPHRPECGFAYKGLASCGLVLSVAAALRKEMGVNLDVRPWLDLVAIGTIADVAPLTGDNRVLVRAGLSVLRQAERPGLRALMDLIGIDRTYPLTAADVAFRIAPRLNAPGRMGPPDLAFRLMREKDPTLARSLADQVEHQCQVRRADQAEIEQRADEQIDLLALSDQPALVLGDEGWNHGIVGIVAGRLAEKWDKPVCVIGFEEGVGRGSLRGPDGFPLFDALSECQAHVLRFGGHQAAAGVTLSQEKMSDFRAAFTEACARRSQFERPPPPLALRLAEGDRLKDVLSDLYVLEPCGEQNPAPLLQLACRITSAREVKGGHLKLDLEIGTERVGGFGPKMGALAKDLGVFAKDLGGDASVLAELRPDRFRGGDAVELLVTQVDCKN